MKKKLFDYVIGNPPYQEETDSDSTRMPPIYNLFMDEAYKVAEKVELITPARFLFDAGYTPGEWNKKMLNDEHLKVIRYVQKSDEVFPGTDIKGGVAVTYRDARANFGAIGVFTAFDELNHILSKVTAATERWLPEIIASPLSYKVSKKMLEDYPDSIGRLRTSAFTKLSEIFYEEAPNDGHKYIGMYGLLGNSRVMRYVRKDYIDDTAGTLDYYKVFVPAANGSGALGEVLSTPLIGHPLIGHPLIGHTQTFISIGRFKKECEAEALLKYVKSKFARAMLGILKITQHNPAPKWKYVPLQNFTSESDIDWTEPVHEIARQLYRKYGLDAKEIDFIETHVKEMA